MITRKLMVVPTGLAPAKQWLLRPHDVLFSTMSRDHKIPKDKRTELF